ncbi:MAG: fumarate/nitrate reduction transcriptional regulator Fnr [Burkholderiales bacterium]
MLAFAERKSAERCDDPTYPTRRPALHEVNRVGPHCETCALQRLCLPLGFEPDVMHTFDEMVGRRVKLHKGDTLFRPGEKFASLYAIRIGSCKTVLLAEDGRDQVSGFHMAGDIIGTDGIGTDVHDCQAVALEDMEVCAIPFSRIEDLARDNTRVLQNMHRMLAREISRERYVMLMLGTMRADQRLAAFLLDLATRYHARGYSATEFVLRMTRDEIGSYLGLKLETVSRLLSRMHRDGLIQVQGRVIKLLDTHQLKVLVGSNP